MSLQMLTDAPPREGSRVEFLKSDRTKNLDLPQNGSLPDIVRGLESAMKASAAPDARKSCVEFLAIASEFYKVPPCGIRARQGHCECARVGQRNSLGITTQKQC